MVKTNKTKHRRLVVKQTEVPNPPGSSKVAEKKNLKRAGVATLEEYKPIRKARKKKETEARKAKHATARAQRGLTKAGKSK